MFFKTADPFSALFQRLGLFLPHDRQPIAECVDKRKADADDGHAKAVDELLARFLIGFAVYDGSLLL